MLHLVLAAVALAAAPYRLDNPAQVLVAKDGALLVAERGTHNRVLRVNPATGTTAVYARGISAPWGLGYAPDGSVLVSNTSGLSRRGARPVRVSAANVSPFAVLPDGRIAYANETSAGVTAGGGAHPWSLSVSVPHGLSLLPDGALALGDTGNNRILRVDPATGAATVLTDRVSNALGVAAEPSGSLLKVEYTSGRLLRVAPDGAITVVAAGLHNPYALARTRGGVVYVTEAGELARANGSLVRVLPDGRARVIPLRPPAPSRTTAAAQPILGQPYDLQPLPNGKVLVTDLPANAVYELDPVRRTGRLFARINRARELVLLKDGRVLVSSGAKVLAVNLLTHRTTVYATAKNYLLGIAVTPDGWLYGSENVFGSEQTTLVRIRGGTREVLGEFHGVHGILPVADGLILSESYGGRVLHFDPETKAVEVLATGLKNPSFTLPAASGGYFVSEFFGARISHLWPDGHVTTVARVVKPGPIVLDSRHRIIGITQSGTTLFRVVRGRAQQLYP